MSQQRLLFHMHYFNYQIIGELLNETKEYILCCHLSLFQIIREERGTSLSIYKPTYHSFLNILKIWSLSKFWQDWLLTITWLRSILISKILQRGNRLPDWFEDTENRRWDSTGNVWLIQGDGSKRERPRGGSFFLRLGVVKLRHFDSKSRVIDCWQVHLL